MLWSCQRKTRSSASSSRERPPGAAGSSGAVANRFAWVCVIVLSACTPTWDWREIRPTDAPLSVMLPGKPAEMTRTIDLDGVPVAMTMHGALVDGLRFTAAWFDLPVAGSGIDGAAGARAESQREATDRALAAMQAGMLRNIAGTIENQALRRVPLLDTTGKPQGDRVAQFIDATGTVQGESMRMQAMFTADGSHCMQFVIVGKPWSDGAAQTFFAGVRLRMLASGAR